MRKYHDLVHKFPQVKVLVVGDAMMDQYHFGRVDRLSPEAPVPVFIEERQKARPGGAANVCANLTALGCQVRSVLPRGPNLTMKHRYVVGHHYLFRSDHDVMRSPSVEEMCLATDLAKDWADVAVLSDYAKGWLTEEMCQGIIGGSGLVIVDPKGMDWRKYRGAELICPNHLEMPSVYDPSTIQTILEKRGAAGLRLHRLGSFEDFPASAKAVFDVTGAGDTVVSAIAAVLGACGSLQDAAVVANHAAGIVVGKIGTSECSAEELLCALDSPTDALMACTPGTASSFARLESTATGLSLP